MSKIKLKNSEDCIVSFDHCQTKEASSLHISRNPLTGDWLQTHRKGDQKTSYYSTKTDAVRLANIIVAKSAELKLRCDVTIKPRTTMPE